MKGYKEYGPLLIRIFAGLLMLVPGITKLMNPSGIQGLIGNIGFPIPEILGWIVLLSEIIFGIMVILGLKVKYAVWPLAVILAVALFFVALPNANGSYVNSLFHLLGIATLISLSLTGPGTWSLEQILKER